MSSSWEWMIKRGKKEFEPNIYWEWWATTSSTIEVAIKSDWSVIFYDRYLTIHELFITIVVALIHCNVAAYLIWRRSRAEREKNVPCSRQYWLLLVAHRSKPLEWKGTGNRIEYNWTIQNLLANSLRYYSIYSSDRWRKMESKRRVEWTCFTLHRHNHPWAFRLKCVRAKIYFDVEISQGELEWLV